MTPDIRAELQALLAVADQVVSGPIYAQWEDAKARAHRALNAPVVPLSPEEIEAIAREAGFTEVDTDEDEIGQKGIVWEAFSRELHAFALILLIRHGNPPPASHGVGGATAAEILAQAERVSDLRREIESVLNLARCGSQLVGNIALADRLIDAVHKFNGEVFNKAAHLLLHRTPQATAAPGPTETT